jgi:murein endopeptidase
MRGETRRRLAVALAAATCVASGSLIGAGALAQSDSSTSTTSVPLDPSGIEWHPSIPVGKPWDGRLLLGVQLPAEGPDFFTWDWGLSSSPNRPWRRWGCDGTIRILLGVVARYRAAHPDAPRVGVADLSRTHGGDFGRRFGGLGHASHQNGLDVDVLYPRLDGREVRASRPDQIDRPLAQDLLNRFVRAGARPIFVGPHTGLAGPRGVVGVLPEHDDHMHVRFPKRLGAPEAPRF